MLTAEQGAELHGQIAKALQDLDDGGHEVVKTRLRRLQELVDDALPDVDGERADGMTFEEFMQKTLAAFPRATVSEDSDGYLVIYPGYFQNPITRRVEETTDDDGEGS